MVELRHRDLAARMGPDGELVFLRSGQRLPWRIAIRTGGSVRLTDGSEHAVTLNAREVRRLGPGRVQWLGEVAGAALALDVALDDEGLACTFSPLGGTGPTIASAQWPGAVTGVGAQRAACWCNHQQGAFFQADGRPWETMVAWARSVCRFGGLLADREALAVIVEDPFDAVSRIADDGRTMRMGFTWVESLGTLAYRRTVRFVPLAEASHVAIAKAFRHWAQRHGLWVSWAERMAGNPAVARLVGAFVACAGYWHDDEADIAGTMRALRAMGFARGYVFSPRLYTFGDVSWAPQGARPHRLADSDVAAIQGLGYLAAPFLQVEEASPESVGAEALCRTRDGGFLQRWQIGDCRFYEIAKWRIPAMLPRFDKELAVAQAMHFDTLTAMPLAEHWGQRPYDHRDDLRLRREIARYYRRQGKVICAECMIDEATVDVDMGTAKAFTPVYGVDPRTWAVPLADLVYHDSFVRCHWEHHPYDDNRCVRSLWERSFHPWACELDDLLTASPPVLFPSGMLYEFGHDEVALPDGRREWRTDMTRAWLYRKRFTDPETQEALPKALRVCRLNERHGVAEMVSHRFLDGWRVQQSEFASGLRVTVNYGEARWAELQARSAEVIE